MKLNLMRLALPALWLAAASCASDPNPIDLPMPAQQENAQAFINLSFDVNDSQETRAGELESTVSEKDISKVALYIFDADGKLESVVSDKTVVNGQLSETMSVSTGVKTIYAIAYVADLELPSYEMSSPSIQDFKKITFSSSLDKIAKENGFVMIGESQKLNMVKGSNDVAIDMTRVAAKAQVKVSGELKLGDVAFSNLQFKVLQSSKEMSVGGEVNFAVDGESENGANPHLTPAGESGTGYIQGIAKDSNFTAEGCGYMAENPFASSVTGDATFVSVRMKATPAEVYNASKEKESFNSGGDGTFYAVGKYNSETAVTSYALNGGEMMLFGDDTEARTYCENYDPKGANGYQVITFANGWVYYRVNIKHGEEYKVLRNTFYKVSVSEVLAFGSNKEVVPTDASTPLDITSSSLGVKFSVADWNGENLDVKLE